MLFNMGEHAFCGPALDDPSSFVFTKVLAECSKLSWASSYPYNVPSSFASETLHKPNLNMGFVNSTWLSIFSFSPYVSYDVDSDAITKIPTGSSFNNIDVYFPLKG